MKSEGDLGHIVLVSKFGESILLFIRKEDINENNPTALMYNLLFKTYHISPIDKIVKLANFVKVNSEDVMLQDHYTSQVYRIIPLNMIKQSIIQFTTEVLGLQTHKS